MKINSAKILNKGLHCVILQITKCIMHTLFNSWISKSFSNKVNIVSYDSIKSLKIDLIVYTG
jgi:hypothetical protein